MQVNTLAHPRAADAGVGDGRNVVDSEIDNGKFVGYILNIVRISAKINEGTICSIDVGALNSKTLITAEMGGDLIGHPPKRVADVKPITIV